MISSSANISGVTCSAGRSATFRLPGSLGAASELMPASKQETVPVFSSIFRTAARRVQTWWAVARARSTRHDWTAFWRGRDPGGPICPPHPARRRRLPRFRPAFGNESREPQPCVNALSLSYQRGARPLLPHRSRIGARHRRMKSRHRQPRLPPNRRRGPRRPTMPRCAFDHS